MVVIESGEYYIAPLIDDSVAIIKVLEWHGASILVQYFKSDKLQLYTAVNEAFIEHGFAAQPDGTLHTFLDYAIGQRNNRLIMLQNHSVTAFSCPKQYRKRYLETPSEGSLPSEEVDRHG